MKTIFQIFRRLAVVLCVLVLAAVLAGRERMERLAMRVAAHFADRAAAGRVFEKAEDVPAAEVGIVPGASIRSPHLKARAEMAAALYQSGKVQRLLLSGDGREASYDEPAALRRMLVELGVPDSALTEDKAGLSTWETLERARSVHGIRRAVVITQEFHSSRVVLLGRHFDLDVTVCCAASPADTRRDEARESRARVRALMDMAGLRNWTATCESDRSVSIGRLELAKW